MMRKILAMTVALAALPVSTHAQSGRLSFDQAAYVSCREAQAMSPDARRQVAVFLAEHAARHRGVVLPTDDRGGQLAALVRGGCTLAPDAYLFTVIDRAIVAEQDKLPKR
jgi:hypothetical protein